MRLDVVKIRSEMYRQGITQVSLAKVAGLGRSTINAICTGKACNDISARRIAKALGVELDDITE